MNIDEVLNFIESTEMRDYLKQKPELIQEHWYGKIVSYAPVPLEKKLPVLERIAPELAKIARTALDEKNAEVPLGTVYLLEEGNFVVPFTNYKAALQYIEEITRTCTVGYDVCYDISKYTPVENGKMRYCFHWLVTYDGEIWYCDDKNEDFYDSLGNLNLPAPFQPGDIITADCRPFAKEKHVLITSTGDNHDCCSLQCLYLNKEGRIVVGPFKHNTFLENFQSSPVSGLYRAARYDGALLEHETPLGIISEAIKTDSALGETIERYIYEQRYMPVAGDASEDYCYELVNTQRNGSGVAWADIKHEFGL